MVLDGLATYATATIAIPLQLLKLFLDVDSVGNTNPLGGTDVVPSHMWLEWTNRRVKLFTSALNAFNPPDVAFIFSMKDGQDSSSWATITISIDDDDVAAAERNDDPIASIQQ
ncbi:hypothetical protein HMI54_001661 [Coelomomyces lativittatus]|nr:hypothetical protein HMI54_001661 [Coelomomyces lativittatus]